MNKNKGVWWFVILLGASGISLLQADRSLSSPQNPPVAGVSVTGYRKWVKVNPEPQLVFSQAIALCAAPVLPTKRIDPDPHANKYVTVYVNEVGKQAMLQKKKPTFPVGSVIVKEKLATEKSETPELLTVMRKREKGYNPPHGDWEYLVLNGSGTKVDAQGRLKNCQTCHAQWKGSDYVSRTYLTDAMRKHLK